MNHNSREEFSISLDNVTEFTDDFHEITWRGSCIGKDSDISTLDLSIMGDDFPGAGDKKSGASKLALGFTTLAFASLL